MSVCVRLLLNVYFNINHFKMKITLLIMKMSLFHYSISALIN